MCAFFRVGENDFKISFNSQSVVFFFVGVEIDCDIVPNCDILPECDTFAESLLVLALTNFEISRRSAVLSLKTFICVKSSGLTEIPKPGPSYSSASLVVKSVTLRA